MSKPHPTLDDIAVDDVVVVDVSRHGETLKDAVVLEKDPDDNDGDLKVAVLRDGERVVNIYPNVEQVHEIKQKGGA